MISFKMHGGKKKKKEEDKDTKNDSRKTEMNAQLPTPSLGHRRKLTDNREKMISG